MKKTTFSIIFLMYSIFSFSQGEANIWYFGQNAGLDFNSGSPVALTNGQLITQEGCATLSNAAGQLLFYTDGVIIYNKNHEVMLNGTGLMGHDSSTQSATIVPKPGSSNLFYVFTIDAFANPNGFRYSIIDITLDGGLGGVTSDKNILVYAPTCEKISIVKNSNGTGFWIITHGWNNNSFNAHLLTASGLNTISVVSNVGLVTGEQFNNSNNSIGYMKISPDGSKLAVWHKETLQLFDFNTVTGLVSNPQTIMSQFQGYGLEFSPNSEILYVSKIGMNSWVYQFNLNVIDIPNSRIVLVHNSNTEIGALQLGPDGKIYIAEFNQSQIGVINNPNVLGLGCNLQMDAIDLMYNKFSRLGLPAFNQSFFYNPVIKLENACVYQSTQFELNANEHLVNPTWNFGDGSPTSNSIVATHSYNIAGTYTVTVTATNASGTSTTSTRNIIISPWPNATQPTNMLQYDSNNDGLCRFDLTSKNSIILNGQNPSLYTVKYYANADDFANKVAIATPGSYQNTTAYQQQTIIAEVFSAGNEECSATTTFTIDVNDLDIPDYFTPNGDGFNDYWNIKRVSDVFITKTVINIFDRFGKLLKQISPIGQGWNGIYNNKQMPANDYWYSIELEDGYIIKGHFALKR